MNPEAKAREIIDSKLIEAGYVVQDMDRLNIKASLGVVVREFPSNSGPIDYLIFIDGKPIGVIEAKETNKAENLTAVELQSKKYAESGLLHVKNEVNIRFAYEATDIITRFTDYKDIKYRSREVFSFHKPETLKKWLEDEDTLRNNLKKFPAFDTTGFRDCQTQAIMNLEKSFAENRPRALVQMATGAGKTFTAITNTYRLLKFAKAKRILFLVDTKNLGEQAEEEFRRYKPTDDARLFPELYNVCRLNSPHIPDNTHICISTIQRMYSILSGNEMDDALEIDLEDYNPSDKEKQPKTVNYNAKYPPEFFDFVIIDESHRSIYNIWQQVLDYFDAFLIGLTATPDNRTFGFFQENIVSEYSHEEAVIDGVNVGREGTFIIETEISQKGALILRQKVEKRSRLSRQKRWEQLDEDLDYSPSQLDKDVVNPSQIRQVIRAFKEASLTTLFPNRKELPKTLIFAKTDSHADDIINIVREEFGEGNEFCKKITYNSDDDPKSALSSFRNDYNPRIAVTVNMIATGTDVKPLECLIFMRDVRSKNYFEQMLGRATRTLSEEALIHVSPSATEQKLGYILVDAVGVTKSNKTASRQLERKINVSLKELLVSVAMNAKDEDTLTSLAGRLIKLDKVLTAKEKAECIALADISLTEIAKNMLNGFDPDNIEKHAKTLFQKECPSESELEQAQENLLDDATKPIYNPDFRDFILNARKAHDQVIDNVNIDNVTFAGWEEECEANADKTIVKFKDFIEANKDTIAALNIIYKQSYRTRYLTLDLVKELYQALRAHQLSHAILWKAYEIKFANKVQKNPITQLSDIISLIRFELGQQEELSPFKAIVKAKFKAWVFDKNAGHGQFTEEQMEWLQMIRDHIANSMLIEKDDLEYTPFDKNGGLAKFYQLFGDNFEEILKEINYALVA